VEESGDGAGGRRCGEPVRPDSWLCYLCIGPYVGDILVVVGGGIFVYTENKEDTMSSYIHNSEAFTQTMYFLWLQNI